ncbi:MAG: hypothetical protein MZU95_12315 [Desulfomicrobium escambiense]|nr:hypothetical protein [Desulfomicrobium escambiense]
MARIFGLMPVEIDLLIMALAVDLNPHYERIYGYLNDDLAEEEGPDRAHSPLR